MALFGTKKNTKKDAEQAAQPVQAGKVEISTTRLIPAPGLSGVLKHARITEKATMRQGDSVYTFDVEDKATKRDVARAMKTYYGVTPRKVAVVKVPSKTKRNMRTGRTGVKSGGKKAYVYLKKGDTITIQ
jgi:ribosomal protein L23